MARGGRRRLRWGAGHSGRLRGTDDAEELLAFDDFPAQYCIRLRTTDVIVKEGRSQPRYRHREWGAAVACRVGVWAATETA